MQEVLDDWRTAPVGEGLRATLGLLDELTLRPQDLQPEHVAAVRAAGVSRSAIIDAIHVCAQFNVIDRVADSLGFDVPSEEQFERRSQLSAGLCRLLHRAGNGASAQSRTDYRNRVHAVREAVLLAPGETDKELRKAVEVYISQVSGWGVQSKATLPEEIRGYVDTVARHAYKVTDQDIGALREAGYSEDAIFEITITAAVSAGINRVERGLLALEAAAGAGRD